MTPHLCKPEIHGILRDYLKLDLAVLVLPSLLVLLGPSLGLSLQDGHVAVGAPDVGPEVPVKEVPHLPPRLILGSYLWKTITQTVESLRQNKSYIIVVR